jgi:hypothetical protein
MRLLFATLLLVGCRTEQPYETPALSAGATPTAAGVAAPVASVGSTPASAVSSPAASPPATLGVPGAGDCIVVDQDNLSGSDVTLEGRVAAAQQKHPNGSMFTFYTLQLPATRCVRGAPDAASVTEVQLAPASDGIHLEKLVGRRVRIKGRAFPWHTAWHVRPVLVSFDAIDQLPQ